ncbi:MAG: type II toxin-antitoxin system PemK/MazF family toxin [Pirellulales bacterium]
MGTPAVGEVVLVRFPFSDMSQLKLRPAVCLADAGRADWVLCQVTSNAYGDPCSVTLNDADFITGGLRRASHARPGKLFTANEQLIANSVGRLRDDALRRIVDAVVALLRSGIP